MLQTLTGNEPDAPNKDVPPTSTHMAPGDARTPRLAGGDILASGFGMTVAVWITAYICRMPLVNAPGHITVGIMLAVLLLSGFVTARYSRRGLRAALLAGAISGFLDILIIGSMIHDYMKTHDASLVPSAALWCGGSLLLNIVTAGIGGAVGRFFPSPRRGDIWWGAVFSLILAAATLPLITIGGLVTAFHAGLAVPDWPQSYGYNMFLFPLSMMQKNEGNFFEHSHRLMGALVGATCLALAFYQSIAARRPWLKALPWIIGCAIAFQAWLGGARVYDKSTILAVVHGIFAQLVFAAMAAQVVLNMRSFAAARIKKDPGALTDHLLTVALVALLVIQLTLGSLLRHENAMLMVHITMAVFVLLAALACGVRAWGLHGELRPLRRAGIAVLIVVLLQVTLGVIAVLVRVGPKGTPTDAEALLTTAHQANGALLLALATVLMIWMWRQVRSDVSHAPQ